MQRVFDALEGRRAVAGLATDVGLPHYVVSQALFRLKQRGCVKCDGKTRGAMWERTALAYEQLRGKAEGSAKARAQWNLVEDRASRRERKRHKPSDLMRLASLAWEQGW
jgi:hypothetical protein